MEKKYGLEESQDKGKKLQFLCGELAVKKKVISEHERHLKRFKEERDELVKQIIPLMKELKIQKVSYETGVFSFISKALVYFPSKEDLMARKACITYLSNLLGPDGLISLVAVNFSTLTKLQEENREHLAKYWEEKKKKSGELKDIDITLIPGIKKRYVKEDVRLTKK